MKVFNDHITLWNGGKLPPDYTVERLMEPHESHPRNRLMASVFYLAGFIEAWGRGYEKIRNAFEAEGLVVPVFEEVRGGMMATIKREKFLAIQAKKDIKNQKSDQKNGLESGLETEKWPIKWPIKWPEKIPLLLEAIMKERSVTIPLLEKQLGMGHSTIKKMLKELQLEGVIRRVGSKKNGYWEVIEQQTSDTVNDTVYDINDTVNNINDTENV